LVIPIAIGRQIGNPDSYREVNWYREASRCELVHSGTASLSIFPLSHSFSLCNAAIESLRQRFLFHNESSFSHCFSLSRLSYSPREASRSPSLRFSSREFAISQLLLYPRYFATSGILRPRPNAFEVTRKTGAN
jgi:hypothetical protein